MTFPPGVLDWRSGSPKRPFAGGTPPPVAPKLHLAVLVDRKATQESEVVQELRCAEHDAAEGIVGDAYGQAGFIPDLLVQVPQKRSTPRKDHATIADVG